MKLKELKCGSKFTYKGHQFTKLSDERNSCYCLLNDTVFESKFGEINDWAKSTIRKRLNEFDKKGNSNAVKGITKDDLVAVSLNYYAYGIPNGRTTDRITCLSWEEWYAHYYVDDFEITGYSSWLRSGDDSSAYNASALAASGNAVGSTVSSVAAVRPALHLRKDLEVQ